ncbi:F-box protein [Sesbania bispinosa]|nr:F-box protein [Sesbania bispinosa]
MVMEYLRGEEACENLGEELRLSWIVIDSKGKRVVNASSGKAATVWRHWLSGPVKTGEVRDSGWRWREGVGDGGGAMQLDGVIWKGNAGEEASL